VNPALVAHDEKGAVYSVRYEAINAMLLNEFLKEHRKVEQLEMRSTQQQKDFQSTIAQQQKQITELTTRLQQQSEQIQAVSDQLQLSKPTPRVVDNIR
jgi:O-acetylhomoserine/O-acetylserine sulfhydrylase-like pyridoxal-dependent enzyme